ncbi:MAG TPA: YebC/PmpR family DNA-binding transcriptional regulator, partial [Solirubrobacterales bacterium]
LEEEGIEVESSDVAMEPKSTIDVGEGEAASLLRLLDALEELDDVNEVHANFDIPDEVMQKVAAA